MGMDGIEMDERFGEDKHQTPVARVPNHETWASGRLLHH
jgi:hypothetical protein